jgi:hypothetical protein
MPSVPDPYTPGQVPRVLAGRVEEISRIRDQVGRVVTFGELGGPLLVFHAPRGLGKTSLLRAGQRQAAEVGCVTAWVACSRDRPFLGELFRAVERALVRAEVVGDSDGGWRTRLDRISIELGVPGAKVRADLGRRDEAPTGPGYAPIAAAEDLLHEAAVAVRDRGGAGLVVFLDELHAASADDMATLLNAVQNLDGEREDNPLAVITAGLPVTPEALTRAATFGERSSFIALDVLSAADAATALTAPAEALGVSWSAEAVGAVLAEAHGHPYLLQLLGHSAWAASGVEEGGEIALVHVQAGIPAARAQLESMYRARWGAAGQGERSFLAAMAAVAHREGTENVTRAAIAAELDVATYAVSVPRERLIEKGIIEPVGHGLVRFTLPGFGEYLVARDRA